MEDNMAKPVSYTVVEFAGYEGENDVASFNSARKADEFVASNYQVDEVDEMHVCVRRQWADGRVEY
jgi:hypothetical protein